MKQLLFLVLMIFSLSSQAQQRKLTVAEQSVKKTVTDFYKWYAGNWKKMDSFKLYKGKKAKDAPPYMIDWKTAEKYFTFIRSKVPQLGETFISNQKIFFKQCQSDFDANPGEEIASGFDYDRFVGGQEDPALVIKETILAKKNDWDVIIKGNKATVFIFNRLNANESNKGKVEMVKEKGVWKLAKTIESVTE
jgi:hypothetical protein